MSILGAIIPALGSIGGGALESYGAAAQSHRGRQFAREMAGTQYQRAVTDMRAAGLNPMAIFGNGGGTPASSMPGEFSNAFQGASGLGDTIAEGITRYETLATLEAQRKLQQANARRSESEADLVTAENSAYQSALRTDAGRAGAITQRYGRLGGAGEVMGWFGVGNAVGGDHSAKSGVERRDRLHKQFFSRGSGTPEQRKAAMNKWLEENAPRGGGAHSLTERR